jgi:hypothetical protein
LELSETDRSFLEQLAKKLEGAVKPGQAVVTLGDDKDIEFLRKMIEMVKSAITPEDQQKIASGNTDEQFLQDLLKRLQQKISKERLTIIREISEQQMTTEEMMALLSSHLKQAIDGLDSRPRTMAGRQLQNRLEEALGALNQSLSGQAKINEQTTVQLSTTIISHLEAANKQLSGIDRYRGMTISQKDLVTAWLSASEKERLSKLTELFTKNRQSQIAVVKELEYLVTTGKVGSALTPLDAQKLQLLTKELVDKIAIAGKTQPAIDYGRIEQLSDELLQKVQKSEQNRNELLSLFSQKQEELLSVEDQGAISDLVCVLINGDHCQTEKAAADMEITATAADDQNNNDVPDQTEKMYYGSAVIDIQQDSNKDGIPDIQALALHLDPKLADTDGDGVSDIDELNRGLSPLALDTDGDGFLDSTEIALGSDPLSVSAIPEDSNNNKVDDAFEKKYQLDIFNGWQDSDNDGCSDVVEYQSGSDPTKADSDNDGFLDCEEITEFKTNPSDANSNGNNIAEIKITNWIFGAESKDATPVFSGIAPKNIALKLSVKDAEGNAKTIASGNSTGNAKFLIEPESELQNGQYVFTVTGTFEGKEI